MFALVARPLLRGLARLRAGEELPPAELESLRILTLRLGRYGAWIGVAFWVGASVIYPVCLNLMVPGMPAGEARRLYLNFGVSLTLCGLIAAAYPFFAGTALGTWAIYPALLRPGTVTARDRAEVGRVERALWPFLALAAAVPLVGAVVLIAVQSQNRMILVTLCGAALAGLGAAVFLARRIQRDLADLAPVIFPQGADGGDTTLTRSWEG